MRTKFCIIFIATMLLFACTKSEDKSKIQQTENKISDEKVLRKEDRSKIQQAENKNSDEKVLREEDQKYVNNFKEVFKSGNKEELAKLIRFPLRRDKPIPAVENAEDFFKRYDHIFDEFLTNKILESSTEKDWEEMGWRGIMLGNGIIWMDFDGTIIAINHSTEKEQLYKQEILNKIKVSVHSSLQDFTNQVAYLETEEFKIRIDLMADKTYRYASWSIDKSISDKPDLIIYDGSLTHDGNGGNHHYNFTSNNYKYEIYIYLIGKDETPPATLKIYEDGKIILQQNAVNFES
ncbi:MAG: hypothetical protein JXR63_03550 [Spirochaetales bacterium]|nr:hypothetical protein [Spirochaetales bacterium]